MFNLICRIERWRFNDEYDVYVSSEGRLRDKNKKEIFPKISHNYLFYYSCKDGVSKRVPVHRLVMMTFKPIKDYKKMTVDHLNHNTRDNALSNLEWVTNEENQFRSKRDHDCEVDRDFSNGKFLEYCKEENEMFLINGIVFSKEDAIQMLCGGAPSSSISRDKIEVRLNQIILEKQQRKHKICGFIIENYKEQDLETLKLEVKINGFTFGFSEAVNFIYSHNSFVGSKESLKKNLLNFLKNSQRSETIMFNFHIEKC